jgi:hypothetical protein
MRTRTIPHAVGALPDQAVSHSLTLSLEDNLPEYESLFHRAVEVHAARSGASDVHRRPFESISR